MFQSVAMPTKDTDYSYSRLMMNSFTQ